MFKRSIVGYLKFSHRFSIVLFLLFLSLFAAGIWFVKDNFKVNTDLAALFDGDNENVQRLKEVGKRIGSFETFVIVSKSDDFEKNLAFMDKLYEKIEKSELVESIEYKKTIDFFENFALLFLPLEELEKSHEEVRSRVATQVKGALSFDSGTDSDEEEEVEELDLKETVDSIKKRAEERRKKHDISTYFTTDDGKYLAMKIRPSGSLTDVTNLEKIVSGIEEKIAKMDPAGAGVEVEVGGELLQKVLEVRSMHSDLLFTIILCIVLLSIVIIWYFRNFMPLFIVMLPLSAAIIAAMSITVMVIESFNIVSAFSFVILYGLGIDFGIHLLSRYGEEKSRKGKNVFEAMVSTTTHVIPSILSGGITTAAAFMTIYFIQFKGFSDYGLVAVMGIITSLVSYILFFPVFIFFLEKFKNLSVRPRNITVLEKVYLYLNKNRSNVIRLSILITVLSLYAYFNIGFEYDLTKLSYEVDTADIENSVVKQYEKRVLDEGRDSQSRGRASIFLTESQEDAAALTNLLREIEKSGEDGGRIEGYYSLSTFVPEDQDEKLRVIRSMKRMIVRKINALSDENREIIERDILPYLSLDENITKEDIPKWVLNMLKEKDGTYGKFVVLLLSGNIKDMKNVSEIKEKFGVLEANDKKVYMSAPYLLLADIDEIIHKQIPILAVFAMIAVFLTLLILFRKFSHSVLLFIPLLAAVCWMFGMVKIFGIKFNLFNLVIVPTILGTGIDSSIHIFHRYLYIEDIENKIPYIMKKTGGAVLFSSLTTFVGFWSLTFSAHRGVASIGAIASLGIIAATVVNLGILPLIMEKKKTS